MDFTIRKAIVSDAEFIIQAQIDMAYESEGLKLERSVIGPGVQAVFSANQEAKGFYLLAEGKKKEALGCLLVTTEWSDWRNGTMLWIQSLFVINKARRKGVFKNMYLYLQELVLDESNSFRGIRLYVEKDNTIAERVYRNIGMDGEHYNMFQWIPRS